MTKQELQAIVDKSKNKRGIGKKLKKLGCYNTRHYKQTKGINLQEIAKACNEECDEANREEYSLFILSVKTQSPYNCRSIYCLFVDFMLK